MDIQFDYKKDGVKGSLKIIIPVERLKEKYEEIYKKYFPRIRLKGFRPGKAPRRLIELQYGESIKYETLKELISDSYKQFLEKENINPISEPQVDVSDKKLKFEEDLVLTYTFDLPPEIELTEIENIEVEERVFEVTENDIEKELKAYQQQHAMLEEKDGVVEEKDYVTIDFIVKGENGEEIYNFNDRFVIIGEDYLKFGIDEDLKGMRKNEEKEFIKEYPENYSDSKLAGKKVSFKVKVKEIKVKKIPELNDDFAKDYSEFKTLEEWKAEIKKQLEIYANKYKEKLVLNEAFDKIIEKSKILIPETLINYSSNRYIDNYMQNTNMNENIFDKLLKASGKTRDDFKFLIRPSVVKDLKKELILEEIIKKYEIKVTEDDMNNFIKEEAEKSGKPEEEIREIVLKPENKKYYEHHIAIKKANRLIYEKIKKVEGNKYSISDIDNIEKERAEREDKQFKERESLLNKKKEITEEFDNSEKIGNNVKNDNKDSNIDKNNIEENDEKDVNK